MKKISLKIVIALLLTTTAFFACKKDEPTPVVVVDPCTTLAVTLAADITLTQAAFATWQASPTRANCNSLKTAATTLSTKASVCPAVIALPNIQALVVAAAALDCNPSIL